jgi:hypothetical protein
MNADAGLARLLWSLRRFVGFRVFLGLQALWCAQPALGRPAPLTKVPPSPAQGTVSPSGKFTPAPRPGPTNAVPGTPAQAEAALKKALQVRQTGSNTFQVGCVQFDQAQRTVTVPALVNLRTQIVEYALVTERGKAYESLLTTKASPIEVHLAFLLLGVSPVPVSGGFNQPVRVPDTNAVAIEVAWETNGRPASCSLADLLSLTDERSEPQRAMAVDRWLYNGSVFGPYGFAAQQEGSIISVIRDPSALVNNPSPDRDNDKIHLPNPQRLPPEGWPVQVTFSLPRPRVPPRPPPPWASPITPLSTNQY